MQENAVEQGHCSIAAAQFYSKIQGKKHSALRKY